MGSVCDTAEETINYLMAKGEKVGIIKVHLYRPWAPKYFFDVLPKTVKIAVLTGLRLPDVPESRFTWISKTFDSDMKPVIAGGRYGLGSKTPAFRYRGCV